MSCLTPFSVRYISQAALFPLNELGVQLSDVEVLITPFQEALQAKLQALYPASTWRWQERTPSALHMAARTKEKFTEGDFSTDGRLELLYLRKTQAEIEQELKKMGTPKLST